MRIDPSWLVMKFKYLMPVAVMAVFLTLLTGCREASTGEKVTVGNGETLRISGSTTVNVAVEEVAEILRAEKGMDIRLSTQGGSSGGITMVGEGSVQLGMASKPVSDEDRARYPDCSFKQIHIGEDAVALVVPKDVWKSGVRSISREEMRAVYEGRITNWMELGGVDRPIAFFNKEPGHGTREVFISWLYGDSRNAPEANFAETGEDEETRYKVATTKGSLSLMSASWADREHVFALALELEDGSTVRPTISAIAKHKYPMSRSLYVLSNGDPKGQAKVFVRFLLSERGQEVVRKNGYLALSDLVILRLGSN